MFAAKIQTLCELTKNANLILPIPTEKGIAIGKNFLLVFKPVHVDISVSLFLALRKES